MNPRTTLAALVAAALLVSVPAATAQVPTDVDVGGGSTNIKLTKKAAKALKKAKVKLRGAKGARNVKRGIRLAIVSGDMDPIDASPIDIEHNGTLTAKRGKKKVKVTAVNIEDGKLTATVGKRTITLAKLKGGNVVRQGFASTDVNRVKVNLTKRGAKALNKLGKGKKGFKKGAFGTANIDAELEEALIDPAGGGTTTLAIDPGTKATFDSENVDITATAPATQPNETTVVFPIIGGTIEVASLTGAGPLEGQIQHSGGLLFKDQDEPQNELPLSDLFFELDSTPAISVIFGAGRVDAAQIDASAATQTVSDGDVQWNGAVAQTNAASAAVLNASPPTGFGMSLPPGGGTPIGTTATVLKLR